MKNIKYNKILNDATSFQLIRTNPKLTTNVKLTVNESDQMWLDSIEVSSELADDKYKKFSVNPGITHPANLYNFYGNGKTPNEIAFSLNETLSKTKTSNDYKDQYDFSEYFSGARYFPSKQYEERLSYFAPIYLKKDLPEYFVIFKINDPINYKIDKSKAKYPFTKDEYLIDMFEKSTIIKTFDLTESSKVGSYLRKYVSDLNFPTGGLTMNYEDDSYTKFNGILMNSGSFGSKSELLSDFYSSAAPLKHFEQFITQGYERNGIIYPNIINIEFIFNDETSDQYDFNRYVGFYINKIELDKISTDIVENYSKEDLSDFVNHFYQLLKDRKEELPERITQMLPYMIRYNWLYNYQFLDGIEKVLGGMGRRASFKNRMHLGTNALKEHYETFGSHFKLFYPALEAFVKNKKEEFLSER